MMPWWSNVTWDVARAGGFTAYILLSLAMVFGLLMSLRVQSAQKWPRLINDQLHQYLTTLSGVFIAIHVGAVLLDPFTQFTLKEILVPGASHYRPLWMALGIVGAYLGLAIALSSWLRPKIPHRVWRSMHYGTFLVWVLATVHGLGTGSDTRTAWAVAIYLACTGAVVFLMLLRLLGSGRARVGWALATVAALVLGVQWTLTGPMQPGWNAVANNHNGSGSKISLTALTPANAVWTSPFTTPAHGQIQVSGPDSVGQIRLTLDGTLSGQPSDVFEMTLVGQTTATGGIAVTSGTMTFGPSLSQPVYHGVLEQLANNEMLGQVTGPNGRVWTVDLTFTLTAGTQSSFDGVVSVS